MTQPRKSTKPLTAAILTMLRVHPGSTRYDVENAFPDADRKDIANSLQALFVGGYTIRVKSETKNANGLALFAYTAKARGPNRKKRTAKARRVMADLASTVDMPGVDIDKLIATKASTTLSILDEAKAIIYGDREKTYGAPAKNLKMIGDLWAVYSGVPFTAEDVCNMMILLKVARLANDPKHRDSQVDLCGYAALMERIQK